MIHAFKRLVGWSTPAAPQFDRASLAVELGHVRRACLARRQGRCPGQDQCADCAWAEGWTRPAPGH